MTWMPIIAAILSSSIVGFINVWVNYKNRIYGVRKDQMTRGLFLVNRVVSTYTNPRPNDDSAPALDEIRTIFYLYGTKRERELQRDIAEALQNPYASGPQTQIDQARRDKVYGLVADLTSEIREDLMKKVSLS